jgi:hypothetical protein
MYKSVWLGVAVAVLACGASFKADTFKPDDDGYIRHWLVLTPLPIAEGQTGAEALKADQIKEEGKIQPKEGDKVTFDGKEYVWRKYEAKESHIDFNDFLEKQVEDSVGFAVCYIHADKEMTGLKLRMGSDDQARVYLNGRLLLECEEARPLTKDADTAENVTLKKGRNVLVFKIVNEKIDWSGSIRFQDSDERNITNIKISCAP